MPRTKKKRIIQKAPHFSGFNPGGLPGKAAAEVLIRFEEYEALNLCDYELLTQAEAARMMNVSRPTFTRIYGNVRRKIARAFVEGRPVRFEGGDVEIAPWFHCSACQISFSLKDKSPGECPLCRSQNISQTN